MNSVKTFEEIVAWLQEDPSRIGTVLKTWDEEGFYNLAKEQGEKELEESRETNRRLNRRCQEAEAALPSWRKIAKMKFVSGSFGRALLAYGINRANEDNAALRAENERLREALSEGVFMLDSIVAFHDGRAVFAAGESGELEVFLTEESVAPLRRALTEGEDGSTA